MNRHAGHAPLLPTPVRSVGREELETRERQLREAQAVAHIGSWEWDIPTDTIVWSDELYRLYGLAPQSLHVTYDGYLSLAHPDDRDFMKRTVGQAFTDHQPFAFDHRIVRSDGAVREFHCRGQVVVDASGRAVRMHGIAQDVTEHQRAEAILVGEKRVLELLAGGAGLPESLDALCRMIETLAEGVSCSILLLDPDGAHLRHAAAPSLPEAYCRAVDGLAVGPSAGSCGTAAYRRAPVIVCDVASDPLWAEGQQLALSHGLRACWSTPIFDSQGAVLGTFALYTREPRGPTPHESQLMERSVHVAGVAIARARAEQALRDSESRYRSLVEHSLEAVYLWDPTTGRVLEANPAMCRLLGYRAQEILELTPYDFVAHDRASIDDCARRVSELGALDIGPRRWRRKDGALIDVEVTVSRVRLSERDVMFVVARDTGERTRAQHALVRSRAQLRDFAVRLQAIREEERSRIARDIHDEIGQALTALKIDLAYLKKRLPDPAATLDRKIRDMEAIVDATVGTMHRIATELRPGVLDDLGLTAAIRWLGRDFEQRTGIRVRVTLPDQEPPVTPDQATAVFRILQESLTNVARHAKATTVQVRLLAAATTLELVVQDDGRGITEQEITDPHSLGLLGLSERAQACGGLVSVVGVPGRGTTVALFLPLR